jgi:peptidoglycan/LPS O-acetylase OafA/YrhL
MTTMEVAPPIALIPSKPKRYVLALDGVRFLAILIVILKHTGLGATSSFLPLRLIGSLVKIGGGVPLFFIISGYLITGILLDTRSSEHRYRNFIARRSLRIFPLYFAYLLLAVGITWLTTPVPLHNIWVFAFYLQNIFLSRANHFGAALPVFHLWTLGVQEQFYLVWPFLIWSCTTLRRVRGLCWTVIIGSILARYFVAIHLGDFPLATQLMPSRAGEMALGGLLAIERYDETWISRIWPRLMLPLAVTMVALVLFHIEENEGIGRLFVEEVLALLAACFLSAALVPASRTSNILSNRFFTTIGGKYSYGLFILHPVVLIPFCDSMLHLGHSRSAGVARVVITLSLSLVLAVVSYHFLEKPFLSLKRYFPARQKRPDPTTSVAVTSMPAIDLIRARRAS